MTAKQEIIKCGRLAMGFLRLGGYGRGGENSVREADRWMEMLWDAGCHNDRLTAGEKETARRVVLAVNAYRTKVFGRAL